MDMFSALAEPTRRDILELLANSGQMSAGEIYEKFTVSHPAISQHLKVLKDAELVLVEKKAQKRIYSINQDSIKEFDEWVNKLGKMWSDKFDQLDKVLEEEKYKHMTVSKSGKYKIKH
ncbi:MAG TPA: metalloregulator ArsR/SmtB family transcription factor [Candidatus Saccharimonadales bacterium]|nr:metalloregulator ArsR/SmtB family transcription factor [Candidatus Saccharimonadales bacterium]